MAEVPLTEEEIAIIRFVVERYRRAMLFEIANTDSHELRAHLRAREDLLERLVHKLDSYLPPTEERSEP